MSVEEFERIGNDMIVYHGGVLTSDEVDRIIKRWQIGTKYGRLQITLDVTKFSTKEWHYALFCRFLNEFNMEQFKKDLPGQVFNKYSYKWNYHSGKDYNGCLDELKDRLRLITECSKVENWREFVLFDYEQRDDLHHAVELGDIVRQKSTGDVGIVIQLQEGMNFRTDCFGNVSLEEVEMMHPSEIKESYPQYLLA